MNKEEAGCFKRISEYRINDMENINKNLIAFGIIYNTILNKTEYNKNCDCIIKNINKCIEKEKINLVKFNSIIEEE